MNIPYKIKILIRLLLISINVSIIFWSSLNFPIYITLIVTIIWIFQLAGIIRFINRIHGRINYFFESMLNDDFSMTVPQQEHDTLLNQLFQYMQKINTKVKNTLIEIQQQEQYFRVLIEHINIGILSFNEKGFVINANSTFLNLVGAEVLTHIKQFKKINTQFSELIQQAEREQTQQLIHLNTKNGTHHLLLKSLPFKSNDGNLTLISLQDIDQQLDEKELDSWIKLIRVLTHEIMNGIAPITSLSDSLIQLFKTEDSELSIAKIDTNAINTTVRGLGVIKEQSDHLKKFVESYRKITRLPKPNKRSVDLKAYLEKHIMLTKAGGYGAEVMFELRIAMEAKHVQADEKLLNQVILNILKNSLEALENTTNPKVIVQTQQSHHSIEIIIENNGPVIPEEIIDEIFIPFFTTKEDGSGIGLSVSKQIMRLHGGTLKVQSSEHKTRFTLVFPGN